MDLDFLALDSDDDDANSPTSTTDDVLAAARRFRSGRALAQYVAGDGGLRRGAGPLKLDFGAAVAALSSSTSVSEREEYARAVGVIAQSPSHAEALREAGAPAPSPRCCATTRRPSPRRRRSAT